MNKETIFEKARIDVMTINGFYYYSYDGLSDYKGKNHNINSNGRICINDIYTFHEIKYKQYNALRRSKNKFKYGLSISEKSIGRSIKDLLFYLNYKFDKRDILCRSEDWR